MTKLVKDFYDIDENLLEELSHKTKSDYFAKSLNFYKSVKLKQMNQISVKQKEWLEKLSLALEKKQRQRYRPQLQKHFTLWPKKVKGRWVWLNYWD